MKNSSNQSYNSSHDWSHGNSTNQSRDGSLERFNDKSHDPTVLKPVDKQCSVIKEAPVLESNLDDTIRKVVAVNRAKKAFLEPVRLQYPLQIYNTKAHPYSNLKETESIRNSVDEGDEDIVEDPEDKDYTPTNMLTELVLLKSSGFDTSEDKVKAFREEKKMSPNGFGLKKASPNSSPVQASGKAPVMVNSRSISTDLNQTLNMDMSSGSLDRSHPTASTPVRQGDTVSAPSGGGNKVLHRNISVDSSSDVRKVDCDTQCPSFPLDESDNTTDDEPVIVPAIPSASAQDLYQNLGMCACLYIFHTITHRRIFI